MRTLILNGLVTVALGLPPSKNAAPATVTTATTATTATAPSDARDASSGAIQSNKQTTNGLAPFWDDWRRGWHFYEDPEPLPLEPMVKAPAKPPAGTATGQELAPGTRVHELIEFDRLQKDLTDSRQIAVMRPSLANVRRYMELEAQLMQRASTFSEATQRLAWASPELDFAAQGRPVNARALEVFEQSQAEQRHRAVEALGQSHVLMLFYRSDCPYCHAFAPLLAGFEQRHGLQVLGISLDGGALPGLSNTRRDNGISRTLNITQVPALFLAEPQTGKLQPLGIGVLSETQLLERLSALTGAGAVPNTESAGLDPLRALGAPQSFTTRSPQSISPWTALAQPQTP